MQLNIKYKIKKLLPYITFILKHLSVVGVIFLALRNLSNKALAYSDFTPFTGNWKYRWAEFINLWQQDFTGELVAPSYLKLIKVPFEMFFNGQPAISQTLFLMTFFLIGYYGFYNVLKLLKLNSIVVYTLPFFYLFNPAISAEWLNGYSGAIVIYNLMPFVFYFILSILQEHKFWKGYILAILFGLALLNIQVAFWVMFPTFAILIFFIKERLKEVLLISFYGVMGVFFNMPAILNLMFFSANYTAVDYKETFNYTYDNVNFLNIFRLIGNKGSYQVTLDYYKDDIWSFLYLSLWFLIIYFVYKFVSHRIGINNFQYKVYVYLTVVILLFYGIMISVNSGYLDSFIDAKNPVVVSIRNPIKLFYFIAFAFTILLAAATSYIYEYLQNFSIKRHHWVVKALSYTILIFVFSTQIFYNIFYFKSGDFGLTHGRGDLNFYINNKYTKMNEEMSKLNDGYILQLPFVYSLQLKTYWTKNIVKESLGLAMSTGVKESLVREVFHDVCAGNIASFEVNIKYVVIDKNPNVDNFFVPTKAECTNIESYQTPYIYGSYEYFDNLFNPIVDKIIYEDIGFKIIQIKNSYTEPQNYLVKKIDIAKFKIYYNYRNNQNKDIYISNTQRFDKDWELYIWDNQINDFTLLRYAKHTDNHSLNQWSINYKLIDERYINNGEIIFETRYARNDLFQRLFYISMLLVGIFGLVGIASVILNIYNKSRKQQ